MDRKDTSMFVTTKKPIESTVDQTTSITTEILQTTIPTPSEIVNSFSLTSVLTTPATGIPSSSESPVPLRLILGASVGGAFLLLLLLVMILCCYRWRARKPKRRHSSPGIAMVFRPRGSEEMQLVAEDAPRWSHRDSGNDNLATSPAPLLNYSNSNTMRQDSTGSASQVRKGSHSDDNNVSLFESVSEMERSAYTAAPELDTLPESANDETDPECENNASVKSQPCPNEYLTPVDFHSQGVAFPVGLRYSVPKGQGHDLDSAQMDARKVKPNDGLKDSASDSKRLDVSQLNLKWVCSPPVIHGMNSDIACKDRPYMPMDFKSTDTKITSNPSPLHKVPIRYNSLPGDFPPPLPCKKPQKAPSYVNVPSTPNSPQETADEPLKSDDRYEAIFMGSPEDTKPAPKMTSTHQSQTPDFDSGQEDEYVAKYVSPDMEDLERRSNSSDMDNSSDQTDSHYTTPQETSRIISRSDSLYDTPKSARQSISKTEVQTNGGLEQDDGECYINISGFNGRSFGRRDIVLLGIIDEFENIDDRPSQFSLKKTNSTMSSPPRISDPEGLYTQADDSVYHTPMSTIHDSVNESECDDDEADCDGGYMNMGANRASLPSSTPTANSNEPPSAYHTPLAGSSLTIQPNSTGEENVPEPGIYVNESLGEYTKIAQVNGTQDSNVYQVPTPVFEEQPIFLHNSSDPPTSVKGVHFSNRSDLPHAPTTRDTMSPTGQVSSNHIQAVGKDVSRTSGGPTQVVARDGSKTNRQTKPATLPKPKGLSKSSSDRLTSKSDTPSVLSDVFSQNRSNLSGSSKANNASVTSLTSSKPKSSPSGRGYTELPTSQKKGALPGKKSSLSESSSLSFPEDPDPSAQEFNHMIYQIFKDREKEFRQRQVADDDSSDDDDDTDDNHSYVNVSEAVSMAQSVSTLSNTTDTHSSDSNTPNTGISRLKSTDVASNNDSLLRGNKLFGSGDNLDSVGRVVMAELHMTMRAMRDRKS